MTAPSAVPSTRCAATAAQPWPRKSGTAAATTAVATTGGTGALLRLAGATRRRRPVSAAAARSAATSAPDTASWTGPPLWDSGSPRIAAAVRAYAAPAQPAPLQLCVSEERGGRGSVYRELDGDAAVVLRLAEDRRGGEGVGGPGVYDAAWAEPRGLRSARGPRLGDGDRRGEAEHDVPA